MKKPKRLYFLLICVSTSLASCGVAENKDNSSPNNENEEFDLLAQFRENKKNLEKNEIIDYKTENINDIPKVKYLRKSTLKEGILDEDNNENNE